jgi:hypothetical protein
MEVMLNGKCRQEAPEKDRKTQTPQAQEKDAS